ncbi:hypothetical protein GX411_10075 [Candidatus Fermentibacteria bacterium]|nr:hypothetical protein [Candidatus Fermentibacteria bacterium]
MTGTLASRPEGAGQGLAGEGNRPGLAPSAIEVLKRRYPGVPDPAGEWLPPKPAWHKGLPDIDVLASELSRVRRFGRKVVLYGHDDMDGITGLYIGMRVLAGEGFRVVPIVPDRATEDYGLLPSRMENVLEQDDLLLSVDSGCSSVEGVAWARNRGARVVITDHHTLNPPLPEAHAIIDPQRTGFPATVLAGCGVLYGALTEIYPRHAGDPDLFSALALGTVSDRVPLLAWNRYLLARFARVDPGDLPYGLRLMVEAWPNRKTWWTAAAVRQQITSVVGKGLNSGIGRLLSFMRSDDRDACDAEWADMQFQSEQRAQLLAELLTKAMAEKDPQADAFGMILVYMGHVPSGMGGTLASKLCRIFRRGAIVVTARADGVLTGEARSLGDWNMAGFLVSLRKVFTSAGGHAKAAGFSAEGYTWPSLRQLLIDHMATYPTNPVPEPHIDLELASLPAPSDLAPLSPFGPDFPPPAVRVAGMRYLLQLGQNAPGWCISEESGE